MGKIKSIYDAIIKTKVAEDQCTNFLVYLLEKLPKTILFDIIKTANLKIEKVDSIVDITVQYPLESSRPDAVVEFSSNKFLILETKIYPDHFDKDQITRHYQGAKKEFGIDNVWCLFLSGDQYCPSELQKIQEKNIGKIGFISWKKLLELLNDKTKLHGFSNSIIVEEFLTFAKHYKLGKYTTMNAQELKIFVDNYQGIVTNQDTVQDIFNNSIEKIKNKIILECGELVEKNDDESSDTLPCLYRTFDIKNWHIKDYSGFVFINVLLKKIGIVLAGYQNKNEQKKFMPLWDEKYKHEYRKNPNLTSFTWVDSGYDDYAINNGYFKLIDGTSGKLFNPLQISEFGDYFYWGRQYDLHTDKFDDEFYSKIATDFNNLLTTFIDNNGRKVKQTKK
ncbi:MAG: hypothetical protein J0M08_01145 [Bacteroidetes bacterium]|nr:hypothetical protein [Bacteroidota bacterium]